MIHHAVEQGSAEWHQLRLGIPTASCFHKILTPTGKLSAQSVAYMHELLAEWLFQSPLEQFENEWMIHGHEYEDEAASAYAFERGVSVQPGGFFTSDDGMIGSSPDRLVGDDGLLEIKCPKANTHVGYMLARGVDEKYRCQVQGQLWVCERKRLDIVSYCPGLPTVIVPVARDEEFIAILSRSVGMFVDALLAARQQLSRDFGVQPKERGSEETEAEAREIDAEVAEIIAARGTR